MTIWSHCIAVPTSAQWRRKRRHSSSSHHNWSHWNRSRWHWLCIFLRKNNIDREWSRPQRNQSANLVALTKLNPVTHKSQQGKNNNMNCYFCQDNHLLKDCLSATKEQKRESYEKAKKTWKASQNKNNNHQHAQSNNNVINGKQTKQRKPMQLTMKAWPLMQVRTVFTRQEFQS